MRQSLLCGAENEEHASALGQRLFQGGGIVAVDRVCAWNLRCQLGVLVRMPRYSIPLSEFWRYVEERRRTMRLDGQDGHL